MVSFERKRTIPASVSKSKLPFQESLQRNLCF